MSLRIVPCERWHIPLIGNNLRAGEQLEFKAMGYRTGRAAVRACMREHPYSVTCLEDNTPIAAWGYKPDPMILANTAYIWCATTTRVLRHKKMILNLSRDFLDHLHQDFERLESTVSPQYPEAMRWVKWLGFKPTPGENTQILKGVTFINIVKVRDE